MVSLREVSSPPEADWLSTVPEGSDTTDELAALAAPWPARRSDVRRSRRREGPHLAGRAGRHDLARWWPLPALSLVVLVVHGGRPAWLITFFTLTLLWPGTLLARRLFSARVGVMLSMVFSLLLVLHAVLPVPPPSTQPVRLRRLFDNTEQVARDTIQLPLDSATWQALWTRQPGPEAYLYLLVAAPERVSRPVLSVQLNGEPVGVLGPATFVGIQDATLEMHRLRVSRDQLEAQPRLVIEVRPLVDQFAPGTIGLGGIFSYQPSLPPTPSAFFDGTTWTSALGAVMTPLPSDPVGDRYDRTAPVRFLVDLRLVAPEDGHLLGIWY